MQVYLVTNRANGKIYVGKTTGSLERRWRLHCLNAMKRQGFCHFLYRAMRKYGAENFFVQTLTLANSPGELNALERFFIAKFRSFDSEIGYNLTMGGEGVVPNEATRRKLSELRKQRPSPMR